MITHDDLNALCRLAALERLLQPCPTREALAQAPLTARALMEQEATRAKLWPDDRRERNRPCKIRR